jgi:putative ABC transport system permease protein
MKNTPKILNILGLSVAIATFIVVAMISYYDSHYDRSYPGADRIYSVWLMKNMYLGNDTVESSVQSGEADYQLLTGFSLNCDSQVQSSGQPLEEIEDVCTLSGYGYGWQRVTAENSTAPDTISKIQMTIPAYFSFFGIEIKEGSLEKFNDFRNAVISNRLAKILFPKGDAIGQRIILSPNDNQERTVRDLDTLTVIAVYKDLPQNSSLYDYTVVRHYPPGIFYGNLYVKVKDTTKVNVLKEKMMDRYQTAYHSFWDNADTTGDEALSQAEYKLKYKDAPQEIDNVMMWSLHDNYNSPNNFWNLEEHQMTVISKSLDIFGIVLLLIAFANYENFATATVMLNRRKTAIQKVEGCSNAQLRWKMFGQCMLGAIIAIAIGLLIVEVCARTKVIPFVNISLKLADNLRIVWIATAIVFIFAVGCSFAPVYYSTTEADMDAALKKSLSDPTKSSWWRKLALRLRTTPWSGVQFYASFAIILFMTLVFVQNHYMKTTDLGFETENIYMTRLVKTNVSSSEDVDLLNALTSKDMEHLKSELSKLEGIADVTWSEDPVLGHDGWFSQWGIRVGDETVSLPKRRVSVNFFTFFGINMLEGNNFDEVCVGLHEGRIINAAALKEAKQWEIDSNRRNSGIDGIVPDFHNMPLVNDVEPCIYVASSLPDKIFSKPYVYVKLRQSANQDVVQSLLDRIDTLGAHSVHIETLGSLKDAIGKEYQKEDDFAELMALFGAVTLFVALTGLLGMVFLDCMYRRRELTLRRVYGASPGNQLWQMIRNQLIICIITFAAAAPLAVSLFRKWQQHFAYKADIPAWVFLAVFLSITLLALAITAWQTLRTLREDPAEVI